MIPAAIDGDIAGFVDANESTEYFNADLHTYLMNQGHSLGDVAEAIAAWRQDRFLKLDDYWTRFTLTPAGRKAVDNLRGRNLHP